MNLNDIKLNPHLLAELFPGSLVETNLTSSDTKPVLKFLGNNQKNILIIVSNDAFPFLEDQELSFLTNILSACKLSMADVAIINIYNADQDLIQNSIMKSGAIYVLLFGTEPLQIGLPMDFPHFQIQRFDKRTYLCSPSFNDLGNDKVLKTKLWNSLKTLFDLT